MGAKPSKVLDDVWQGGMDVLKDEQWFRDNNIRFVLSLGYHEPAAPIKKTLAGYLQFKLEGAFCLVGAIAHES